MIKKIQSKSKILLVDGMFPNKFTIWRNNLIESLMSEFDVKKYFSHVISESFPADESKGNKEYPKGIKPSEFIFSCSVFKVRILL